MLAVGAGRPIGVGEAIGLTPGIWTLICGGFQGGAASKRGLGLGLLLIAT